MTETENKTPEINEHSIEQNPIFEENIPLDNPSIKKTVIQNSIKNIFSIKVKNLLRNKKKLLILSFSSILLCLMLVTGINLATNNYTTPVTVLEKYANAEEYTLQKYTLDLEGGLARKEIKQIFNILKNSDYYLDLEEEIYDISISNYETRLDSFGDNFSITYTILNHDELTKTDLRDKRAALQEYVYDLESIVDNTEDFSASDWGELAEAFGLLKTETKQLIENISKLAKEYGRIEVSKGYTLSVLITTIGDELDEPIEEEIEFNVYKVNGRWIGESFGLTLDILSDIY